MAYQDSHLRPPPLPPRPSSTAAGQRGSWAHPPAVWTPPPPPESAPVTREAPVTRQDPLAPSLPPRPVSWNPYQAAYYAPPPPPVSATPPERGQDGGRLHVPGHPPPRPPKEVIEMVEVAPPLPPRLYYDARREYQASPSPGRHEETQTRTRPQSEIGGTSHLPASYSSANYSPQTIPAAYNRQSYAGDRVVGVQTGPSSYALPQTQTQAQAPPRPEPPVVSQDYQPAIPVASPSFYDRPSSSASKSPSGAQFDQQSAGLGRVSPTPPPLLATQNYEPVVSAPISRTDNRTSDVPRPQNDIPFDQQLPGHVPYFPPPPSSPTPAPTAPSDLESSLQGLSLENKLDKTDPTTSHERYSPREEPVSPQSHSSRRPTHGEPKGREQRELFACLDFELAFPATWYWHASAPDFLICSKCYEDEILDSRFSSSFLSARLGDDEKIRICRFSKPRMKKLLWKQAQDTGSLRDVTDWMLLRSQVQTCKGMDGTKGGQGHKWYKPAAKREEEDIPGFVACHACYEDHILVSAPFSTRFAAVPESLHSPEAVWACDLAIPYVKRQFEQKTRSSDWLGFVTEAKARLNFDRCTGGSTTLMHGKAWFVPKNGPEGLMMCTACYCDQVLSTGEEDKWRLGTESSSPIGSDVRCIMGQINVKICMGQAEETKDYSYFWNAVWKLVDTTGTKPYSLQQELCSSKGVIDGDWFTFKSDPDDFGICRACYTLMVEPLHLSSNFERKRVPSGQRLLCCLNLMHSRAAAFFMRLLEGYVKRDAAALETFASIWARIPPCKRDQDIKNMFWYGWEDCTICRECYHKFASMYPAMVQAMTLHDQRVSESVMCEMYSPRMRTLFKQVSSTSPLDLAPLLEYSAQRRQVYIQTVPQMRMILSQQQMALEKQKMLNIESTHYTQMGHGHELIFGSGSYTYGAAGVGYGFSNRDLLKGAQLRQEAMGIVDGSHSAVLEIRVLEQRWRAVE